MSQTSMRIPQQDFRGSSP